MTDQEKTGKIGEDAAARYLRHSGYTILERNLHLSHKEIDIIAENSDFLILVEVKTRTCRSPETTWYRPATAMDYTKRKNIADAAKAYLALHATDKQPRLDVIEVYLSLPEGMRRQPKILKINHIPDAFGAYGQVR